MNDREKSHSAIVAGKPTNNASATIADAAEPVEPRAGTERNVSELSTHRTQGRERVSQALDRVRKAARQRKGEAHSAPAPRHRRSAPRVVLCAETRCSSRCGRHDLGGLRGRP
jgi:hypothetical protein